MKYGKYYGLWHWFVHLFFAYWLVFLSGFRLINYFIPFEFLGTIYQINILDYILIFFITTIIDLDHIWVLKAFGWEGIFKFAQKRITYPLHNFFSISLFAIFSSITALANIRFLSVILFTFVIHMIWDMIEDILIFKTSFRKWEKTWGIGTKELKDMWREMKRLEKEMKKIDKTYRIQRKKLEESLKT